MKYTLVIGEGKTEKLPGLVAEFAARQFAVCPKPGMDFEVVHPHDMPRPIGRPDRVLLDSLHGAGARRVRGPRDLHRF